MKLHLLYFDDQPANIECYKLMLKDQFDVFGQTESIHYAKALKEQKPHGILLDLQMPIMNGFELYTEIINSDDYNGCPIFFISGDSSDETRLKTIQMGGLDFFDRTIQEEELKLRIGNKIKLFLKGDTVIHMGNLKLDNHSFTIYINNKLTDLTLCEFRILTSVIRKMQNGVSKKELMEQIWGSASNQGKMNVHLSNLKLKLQAWDHEIKLKDNLITIVAI